MPKKFPSPIYLLLVFTILVWGLSWPIKKLPSITVSLTLLGVPVLGLFFSALILHEQITLTIVVAGLLIVGGLVCAMLGNNKG